MFSFLIVFGGRRAFIIDDDDTSDVQRVVLIVFFCVLQPCHPASYSRGGECRNFLLHHLGYVSWAGMRLFFVVKQLL